MSDVSSCDIKTTLSKNKRSTNFVIFLLFFSFFLNGAWDFTFWVTFTLKHTPETLLWDHKLSWHVFLIILAITVSDFQTVPLPKHGFRQLAFSAIIFFNGAVQARMRMVLLCGINLNYKLRQKGEQRHVNFTYLVCANADEERIRIRDWCGTIIRKSFPSQL